MGWSSKKPWLDDPNSVIERGHYKGRTWQSLMDETLTCGNIFCELGEDGGRKVLTYEEWASDKVEDSPSLWISRKIEPRNQRDSGLVGCCCHSCSGIISTYRMHYGAEDKERMDEPLLLGQVSTLHRGTVLVQTRYASLRNLDYHSIFYLTHLHSLRLYSSLPLLLYTLPHSPSKT